MIRLRTRWVRNYGSVPSAGTTIFLSQRRPNLLWGWNQPTLQWVVGTSSPEVKRYERATDCLLTYRDEFKEWVQLYLPYHHTPPQNDQSQIYFFCHQDGSSRNRSNVGRLHQTVWRLADREWERRKKLKDANERQFLGSSEKLYFVISDRASLYWKVPWFPSFVILTVTACTLRH